MTAAKGNKSKSSHNLSLASKSTAATSRNSAFGSTWHQPTKSKEKTTNATDDMQIRTVRYVKKELEKSKNTVLEAIQMLELI